MSNITKLQLSEELYNIVYDDTAILNRLDNMDELIESLSNSLASNSTFLNNLNGVINKAFQASDGEYRCPKIVTFPDVTHIVITHRGTSSATNFGPVLACSSFGIFCFYVNCTTIPDNSIWKSNTSAACTATLDGLVTTISTGNRWSHIMIMVGGNLGNRCTIEGRLMFNLHIPILIL